ncbi:MAG: T9SS type A sorting domain-containing protein [Bacteroidia bacterium]
MNCYQGVSINNYVKTTITNDTIFSGATVISPPNIMNLNGDHGIFVKTKYFEVMEINDNSVVNQETGIHLMVAAGGLLYPTAHIMHNKVAAQNTSATFTTTGIFAEGVTGVIFAPYEYLFIDSNMVVNTATCIHARNFLKIGLRIDDNPLLRIRPITSATAGPNQAGILVQNCRLSTVMRNSINSTGTTITNVNHRNVRGIYMINSNSATVTCNQILNTGQSLVFEGGCPGTKFAKNDFTNAYDGFVMRNSAIISAQHDINNPSDNQWIGTFTFSQTYVENTSNINSPTIGSPLYTRAGGTWQPTNNQSSIPLTYYIPNIVNPGFTPADCGSEQLAAARIQNPDPDADETAQRRQIALDMINYAVYPDENAVMNQTNLQAELEHTPSLIDGDTVLQNFSFNNQNSSIGKMNDVEDELGQGNLTNAFLANAAITPTTAYETNQQQYNSIYLDALALSIDSLGPQQISDLFDIALQCPNEGGNAVFEARALLNWALNTSLAFSDSCYSSARIGTGSENPNPIAQVFPNPNDGNITLTYALENITAARFDVCDALGRVLFSTSLDPEKSKMDMQIIGLANGAYIYKLVGDGAIIASGTLIISR